MVLWPGAALATRVQWLGALPPEAQRQQVERTTGPATHLDASSLAWPIEVDALHGAEQAAVAMQRELGECRARWDAFDVEQDIAWRLGQAADTLRILEDDVDRGALYELLLLQGAAVHWAWSPQQRDRLQEAEAYLLSVDEERVYQPWVDAIALEPEREPGRELFPDQASFQAFQRQRELVLKQRLVPLEVSGLPEGSTLLVDGRVVDPAHPPQLVPGRHRLHLDRGGVVAVPSVVRLAPGETLYFGGLIPDEELSRAQDRLLDGNLLDIPDPVKARVDTLRAEAGDEPYYLAAWSGRGAPQVFALSGREPWTQGEFDRQMSLVLDLSLGAGAMSSTAFAESDGVVPYGAMATSVGLDMQLAWRRFATTMEITVADTSGRAGIQYGETASQENVTTSTFTRVSVAPGFYVLRLRPRRPSLLVSLPFGLQSPSHSGLGAQAWLGIPLAQALWLRLGAELWKGNELPAWQALDGSNDELTNVALRVGVSWKAR